MNEKEISQKITQYLKGELDDKQIDLLWEEFLKTPELLDLLETEANLQHLFKNQKRASSAEDENKTVLKKLKQYRGWVYAAAAAVLLGLSLQLFSLQDAPSWQDTAVASIDLTEMMGADIFRADEGLASEADIRINVALARALEDNDDEAIAMFENLLNEELTNQQYGRVSLNLGILRYNKTDFPDAVYHFQQVIGTEELPDYFEEKAWWFMGNAYLQLNDPINAREAIFNAYTMDGRLAPRAFNLLRKLDADLEFSEQNLNRS